MAYFGTGASKRLPLKRGSTLVVDMSERAVRSGQTNPREVLALIRHGVDVHTVENLHAKVFVIGSRAFVGSTNVSTRSAEHLVEAVIFTSDRQLVASCKDFVRQKAGERVTLNDAKRLQKLYRPPRFNFGHKRISRKRGRTPTPNHAGMWLVQLEQKPHTWDETDRAVERAGIRVAQSKLRSSKWFKVDKFQWAGRDAFASRVKTGEQLIQVVEHSTRDVRVEPPARVVFTRRYRRGKRYRVMVFLEARKGLHRKKRAVAQKQVGAGGKIFTQVKTARFVKNAMLVHRLLNLWPQVEV